MVIEALEASGGRADCILDQDEGLWGQTLLGVPVLGGDDRLAELVGRGVGRFVVAVGNTAPGDLRRRLFEAALEAGLEPLTVVHPSAIVSPSVSLGGGAVVLPGAVIGARVCIGLNVIINSRSLVEHDCVIKDHVHIASGACLCGGCIVGVGSFVGSGATIRQQIRIGSLAMIALGAAVVADVPDGATVMGVPARVRKSRN